MPFSSSRDHPPTEREGGKEYCRRASMTDLSLCPVPAFPVHANVKDASSEGVLQFLKSSPYVSAGVVFYSFPSPTPNGSRRHLQSHYLASSRFPCFPSRVNLVSLK